MEEEYEPSKSAWEILQEEGELKVDDKAIQMQFEQVAGYKDVLAALATNMGRSNSTAWKMLLRKYGLPRDRGLSYNHIDHKIEYTPYRSGV